MIGLVMIIFMLAFFAFLFVCMLILFIKDKDASSIILTAMYCLTSFFLVHVLFTEIYGR